MAAPSGGWSLQLPVGFGSTTITVTATLGRSTGYAQRTVINVALPGNSVLDVADPDGDDNGPGTYQYPTAADFHQGAFDLERFRVNEDGTNVYLQATLRNMDPTFGNTFGAQLLDVYVHNPGATSTSTGAAAPTFNYSVAPAWSERLEAQGFASPVWVGPNGSLGSAQFAADQASRTATLIVPEATFGTPASGWAFAVALTGQDGFSSDQARSFAPTPQPFQFGVCAPGGSSPICSVNAGTVPKVMDTVTPAGTSQATELDPTRGPVVLQGVPVP
ncbi:MAG: glucodextranase DOMON-like domain-containing protein [Solirubrobacteraceae bacterium]